MGLGPSHALPLVAFPGIVVGISAPPQMMSSLSLSLITEVATRKGANEGTGVEHTHVIHIRTVHAARTLMRNFWTET